MSGNYENLVTTTYISGENLNGQLYRLLTTDSSGNAVLSAAAADVSIGVLAHDPQRSQLDTTTTSGDAVTVAYLQGKVPIIAGSGGTTAGNLVHADANGGVIDAGGAAATDATAADFIIGVALETVAAGSPALILCHPFSVDA
jgi:hypothetical protein